MKAHRTISSLSEEALTAFWQVIVSHHPGAESGDLSPGRAAALRAAAEAAVKEWITNNAIISRRKP